MTKVEWVPVTEILQNTVYSCDFDYVSEYADDYGDDDGSAAFWTDVIESKASDTGFGHLVESILEHGFKPEGAIGYDRATGEINEGHHRLAAAILLCLDEVPITPYGETWLKKKGAYADHVVCAHYHDTDPYPIHL